jgi:hypothetical protein
MSYQQIREILEAIHNFHRQLRRELEEAYPETQDAHSRFLIRSIRRAEKELNAALARDSNEGESAVLDTWIQYVAAEDLEELMLTGHLPPHASPDEILEWKRSFDEALAGFYRQLVDRVDSPKAVELLESLAREVEQRLLNQSVLAREDDSTLQTQNVNCVN